MNIFDNIFIIYDNLLIDFVKSPEGVALIKKSFIEYYISDGEWCRYDNIADAVDDEVKKVIKGLFKNVKINFSK